MRFVDMRIDIVIDENIELSVGGRWDRRLKEYDPAFEYDGVVVGDPSGAETAVVVRPHPGQVDVMAWFCQWINVHAGRRNHPPDASEEAIARMEAREIRPDEVFAALLAGGRRGGKTWIGAVICAVYAILFPGSIIWVVNANDQKHDEVREAFGELLMREWIERQTRADGWELINGSAIMLKSAYVGTDPDAIKEGKAHLVWMNEAQKMDERVYVVARGAIADHSGLVLLCANPPVSEKDQQWVGDFAADAQNLRRAAIYKFLDPRKNPHINRLALIALKHELDSRTYRIEVLGEFLPPAGTVAHNWVRTGDGNERSMPKDASKWIDVTEEYLREEDLGDGFLFLAGMDFQIVPHMGGPIYRIYMPASAKRPTRANVVVWGVDEVVVEGDELEWCEEAREKGYRGSQLLIVGDGTGEYQHSRRSSVDAPPPEWHGKGSFDMLQQGGFQNVIRPDPSIKRNNPHVIDRARSLTSMIENANGVRRFFLDPDRCPKTCKSIREWPTKNGKPSRTHPAAHLGDGASYPLVRLFPRKLRSETPRSVDPIVERVDVPLAKPKEFGPPLHPRSPRGRGRGI